MVLLMPWFQPSELQNCEGINLCCLELPSLWYFATTKGTNITGQQETLWGMRWKDLLTVAWKPPEQSKAVCLYLLQIRHSGDRYGEEGREVCGIDCGRPFMLRSPLIHLESFTFQGTFLPGSFTWLSRCHSSSQVFIYWLPFTWELWVLTSCGHCSLFPVRPRALLWAPWPMCQLCFRTFPFAVIIITKLQRVS